MGADCRAADRWLPIGGTPGYATEAMITTASMPWVGRLTHGSPRPRPARDVDVPMPGDLACQVAKTSTVLRLCESRGLRPEYGPGLSQADAPVDWGAGQIVVHAGRCLDRAGQLAVCRSE